MHTIARFQQCRTTTLILALWIGLSALAHAEVYKWVDEKGKVHYGDKQQAGLNNVNVQSGSTELDEHGKSMIIYAVADTELNQKLEKTIGQKDSIATALTSSRGLQYSKTAIIKFDTSELLRQQKSKPKKMAFAYLKLTTYKTKQQQNRNQFIRNNAFFVLPTHNNWQENGTSWDEYFNKSQKSYAIRRLPSLTAPSSSSLEGDTYELDALALVKSVIENNLRELSLEIKLQRANTQTDITFHSKESEKSLSPQLVIEFLD